MQCPNPACPWWAENPPNVDTIKTMLVVLEHTLTTLDKTSATAMQLINAHASGKPLPPAALQHYRQEFADLLKHRAKMRELIARWWKLVEPEPHPNGPEIQNH